MANPNNVDLKQDRLFWLGCGLIYATCCCPKSWDAERVSNEASASNNPGTSAGRWEVASPEERDDDWNNVNNLPCPDDPERRHWLVNC